MEVGIPELILRLTLGLVLGAAVGWEREGRDKPAGLRTHMLVSLGAATFTLLTLTLFTDVRGAAPGATADPLRIVSGVVAGIGFLGAGSIIQSQGAIRGLTTAAGIWVTGSIGVACGSGHYALAATVSLLTVFTLAGLGILEKLLRRRRRGSGR